MAMALYSANIPIYRFFTAGNRYLSSLLRQRGSNALFECFS